VKRVNSKVYIRHTHDAACFGRGATSRGHRMAGGLGGTNAVLAWHRASHRGSAKMDALGEYEHLS
jgi:hypothetical protein